MPRKKKGAGERFIRMNLSFPPDYELRLQRLLQVVGAASVSEVMRHAVSDLEMKHGLPPMPAILDWMKKDKAGK